MKSKGITAWLITWEGTEFEDSQTCKIVAFLPPKNGRESVKFAMRQLYCCIHTLTLIEKLHGSTFTGKDPLFREMYRDVNPEYTYGITPKLYLSARRVKNLRCVENKNNWRECTLSWTELPKYVPNPDIDPNEPFPFDVSKLIKEVHGEIERNYTYSTIERKKYEK